MKKIIILILGIVLTTFSSCINDLDTKPKVELTLEDLLQQDPMLHLHYLDQMDLEVRILMMMQENLLS